MTWEKFTRAVTFLLGVVLLVWAAIGRPTRWGLIAIALLLLGVITGEQMAALWHGRREAKDAAIRGIEPGAHFANTEPMAGPPPSTSPGAVTMTPPPGYVDPREGDEGGV